MKTKASSMLKKIVTLIGSVAKSKSMTIKTKTTAFKTRLLMLSLLRSKSFLLGNDQDEEEGNHNGSKKVIPCDAATPDGVSHAVDLDDDGKYPDLTHSLFGEEEDDVDDLGGSVIDMVRNSKEEEGKDFKLEDEIDHVADLFINRFRKQMRLQKLLSFKRNQEMLQPRV